LIEPEYELRGRRKQILGGVLAIAAVVSLFAAGIAAYEMSSVYSKPQWGFRFHIPEGWEKDSDSEQETFGHMGVVFLKNYANKNYGATIRIFATLVPVNLEFGDFVSYIKTSDTEYYENLRLYVTTFSDYPRQVSGVTGWEWVANISLENISHIPFVKHRVVMLFSGGRSYVLTFDVQLIDSQTGQSISESPPLETDFDSLVNSFQLT